MSDLNLHFHLYAPVNGTELFPVIVNQLRRIILDQDTLKNVLAGVNQQLTDTAAQLDKSTSEIVLALQQAGQTNAAVDAEISRLQAMATALKTASQSLDDLNQDQPPSA